MHIHDLPSDILRRVFVEACVQIHFCVVLQYKHNLPLIAVCRKWRYIALPVVHSRVFFQYDAFKEIRDHRGAPDSKPVNINVKTNVEFAVSAGCMRAAKEAIIYIYYGVSPISGLDAVVAMMRAAAQRWCETRALELRLCTEIPPSDENEADAAEHEREAVRVSTALASVMPSVRQLVCDGLGQTRAAQRIHGHLVSQYADQLRKIRTSLPIAMPPDCILRQPRHAAIDCNSIGGRLPLRMDVASLVALEITRVAAGYSWSQFRMDSSSTAIVFPSLKHLYVQYYGEDAGEGADPWHQNETPWKLHFPRLKTMRVMGYHRTCTLFTRMVLPARMDYIEIGMTNSALLPLLETQLPVVKCLKVYIETNVDDRPDMLTIANRVIERMQGSETLELTIYQGSLNLPPDAISTLLTHLVMYPYVGVDYMLALIRRLSRLTSLTLRNIEFDDVQADISVPGPEEFCFVEPLSTSIKHIWLCANLDRWSPDAYVSVAKYLLLGVPTLSKFRALCVPRGPIMDFVEAYSVWHPHLPDIAFKLGDNRSAAGDPDSGRMHIPASFFL